jgi:hypothetical protein
LAGEVEAGRVTIAELVRHKQPEVWLILVRRYLCFVVDWARIMEERPKPGRGGLLSGEEMACGK